MSVLKLRVLFPSKRTVRVPSRDRIVDVFVLLCCRLRLRRLLAVAARRRRALHRRRGRLRSTVVQRRQRRQALPESRLPRHRK